MNLSNIAILNINGADYYCIINIISKNEAINVDKMSIWLKKKKFVKNYFFIVYKNGKRNYNI